MDILTSHINDECPLCKSKVKKGETDQTLYGGKLCAQKFFCPNCLSEYVVGYNRSCNPILSEILIDNFNRNGI